MSDPSWSSSHEALFAAPDEVRCDACDARCPATDDDEGYDVPGVGVYLWTRGEEVRFEKAPLCGSLRVGHRHDRARPLGDRGRRGLTVRGRAVASDIPARLSAPARPRGGRTGGRRSRCSRQTRPHDRGHRRRAATSSSSGRRSSPAMRAAISRRRRRVHDERHAHARAVHPLGRARDLGQHVAAARALAPRGARRRPRAHAGCEAAGG